MDDSFSFGLGRLSIRQSLSSHSSKSNPPAVLDVSPFCSVWNYFFLSQESSYSQKHNEIFLQRLLILILLFYDSLIINSSNILNPLDKHRRFASNIQRHSFFELKTYNPERESRINHASI